MRWLEESVSGRLALHLAGKLRMGAQKSCLCRSFSVLLRRAEARREEKRARKIFCGASPLYRKGMRAREESLFGYLLERMRVYCLSLSLGCYGVFLLTLGSILFAFSFWVPRFADAWEHRAAGGALMVLSLLLLPLNKSLSYALHKSRFFKGLLCGFCLLSEDRLGNLEKGKERLGSACLSALLFGGIGLFLSPVGVLALLLLLPLLLLCFALPECGLCVLLLLFPFLGLTEHPTLLLCVLVGILWISYLSKAVCGRRTAEPDGFDWACIAFCFALLLGGWIGAGSVWEGLVLSALASTALPARQLLGSGAWLYRARVSLLVGASVSAAVGISQFVWGRARLQWVDVDRFGDIGGRVVSFFDNPNILAVYLLLCFPVALGMALERRRRARARIFFGSCALLCGLCLVFTWSRGAWLGALVEIALLLVFSNRKTLAFALLLPFLLLPLLPLLPRSVRNRFSSIGMPGESSIRYRRYTWRGVWRMIGAHPFGIGVGSSAFLRTYPRYAVSGTETVMHAHALLLQLMAEMGLFGLLSFFCCLFFALLPGAKGGLLHARCAICGACVMGLFDHLWYAPGMIALFFCVCAFACAKREERGGEW